MNKSGHKRKRQRKPSFGDKTAVAGRHSQPRPPPTKCYQILQSWHQSSSQYSKNNYKSTAQPKIDSQDSDLNEIKLEKQSYPDSIILQSIRGRLPMVRLASCTEAAPQVPADMRIKSTTSEFNSEEQPSLVIESLQEDVLTSRNCKAMRIQSKSNKTSVRGLDQIKPILSQNQATTKVESTQPSLFSVAKLPHHLLNRSDANSVAKGQPLNGKSFSQLPLFDKGRVSHQDKNQTI